MTMAGDVPECVDANDTECILGVEWDYPFGGTGQYRLLRETGTFFASSGQATVVFSTGRPAGFGYYMPFSLQAIQPNSNCQFGQPFGRPLSVTPSCTYRIVSAQAQTLAAWVVVYPAVVVRLADGTTARTQSRSPSVSSLKRPRTRRRWRRSTRSPARMTRSRSTSTASTSTDDKGIDRYEWDFGDGQTGTGFRPSHPYSAPGTYPVKLTVFDAEGLSNTVQHDVIVRELSLTVTAETPQPQGVRRGQRITYTLDAQSAEIASSLSLTATLRPDLVDVDEASITGGGVLSGDHTTIDWTFSNTAGTNPPPTFEVTVRGDAPGTTQFIPLDVKAHATLTSGESAASTIKLVPLFATRSITIVKQTVPLRDPQNFSFTGSASIGPFTLDTDVNSAEPDQQTFSDLDVGTYTVSEAAQDGWDFDSVTCTDPSGGTTTDDQARSATIDLTGTDSVTCAFLSTRLQRPLVVNSTGDTGDEITGNDCDTGNTITRNGDVEPECTLAPRSRKRRTRAGADTIGFNVPGAGVPVIAPRTELPTAKGPVTIDGSTQPGGLVELLGTSGPGLTLDGSGCVIRGLMIDGFDIGIEVHGSDHEIVGNSFGLLRTGDIGSGNVTGIQLFDATHVVIGGGTQLRHRRRQPLVASDRAIVVGGGRDIRIEGNLLGGIRPARGRRTGGHV